jgi:predicted esterase
MVKIYFTVLYFFLFGTIVLHAQDIVAKTDEGQIVLLKKNGSWQTKDGNDVHTNKAYTADGRLVLLMRNGTWFVMSAEGNTSTELHAPIRSAKNYSSPNGNYKIPYVAATVNENAFVHIPPNVNGSATETRPLMMLLDPDGNSAGIVARWKDAADRFGWIVASTPAIFNGTDSDKNLEHLQAILDAVAATWPIDRHAVVLEGFSGGGCAAYRQALAHPELFRGAVVECGHMGPFQDLQDKIRPGSFFFLATRDQDFNLKYMRKLSIALEQTGQKVKYMEHAGGHEPIRGEDTEIALEWINSMINK